MTDDLDAAILKRAEKNWRKVAFIIGSTQHDLADAVTLEAIADRLAKLVEQRRLEVQGDISNWRHSEVRLAQGN
jgi:hypothetical protein